MDVVKKLSEYFINFCGGDFDRAFEFAQGLTAGKEVGFMTPKRKFKKEALINICDECGIEYEIKNLTQYRKDSVVVYLKRRDS